MDAHTIFKGATRPAMFVGVPLMPLLIMTMPFVVCLGWSVFFHMWLLAVFALLVWCALFFLMRLICKNDNWQLDIELLRIRKRTEKGNISHWGAVSYAPYQLQKRT